LTRGAWRRRDVERRQVERDAYERRRAAEHAERSEAAVADLVERYFPFARAAWVALRGRGTGSERLRRALGEIEGIVVGVTDIGFDAVLPDSVRRQHLICLGKSGYGKSTISHRIIRGDLQRGRGVCILGTEAELFRDYVLPLIPRERAKDVLLFTPSARTCTLSWNPLVLEDGDDQALAAGLLCGIFKIAIGETSIGARADAILSAAFGVLVGRRNATLWSVIRLLEDEAYRAAVVRDCEDTYLKQYWSSTFPEYPAGATLPLSNRLHQFLRLPQLRAALCHPVSSFSIRDALATNKILLFDLSALDVDATQLVGRLLLARFQIELMRRERIPETERRPVCVHVDEFHQFAGEAEGTWRELLARGRRYGLSLSLYTQHLGQIPKSLQAEILGNVSSVIALNLSAGDAASVRRELLVPGADGTKKPVPVEAFVSLPVGEGYARLAAACALRVRFAPPVEKPDPAWGDKVREISWRTYAAPPIPKDEPTPVLTPTTTTATAPATSAPGRGSAPHKTLQKLAKEWGEARGFRATLEKDILGGSGRVDVLLEREGLRIAVEVAIANSLAEVAETVVKDVAAGFDHVVVVSNDAELLRRSEERIKEAVPAKSLGKVRFLSPDALPAFLDAFGAGDRGTRAGYRVQVAGNPEAGRRRALALLVGAALLRRRRSS
jgi:hypothetical protein